LLGFGAFNKPPPVMPATAAPLFNRPVLATAPPKPGSLAPWRLEIPALKIDAAIQKTGKTHEGDMAVASNNSDVAWYERGVKPGQTGNAALAGHLNGGPGVPAVFGRLNQLKPGDFIYVKDRAKRTEQRFEVTSLRTYEVNEAPLTKIFGSAQNAKLNLITCAGSWDKARREYNQRLVVFSELAR